MSVSPVVIHYVRPSVSVSVFVFLCLIVCLCLFSPQSVCLSVSLFSLLMFIPLFLSLSFWARLSSVCSSLSVCLCLFLSESVALYAHPSVSVFLCLSVSVSLPAAVLHIMKLCGTAHVAVFLPMHGTFTHTHTHTHTNTLVRSIIQVHVVVKNSHQTHC